MSGWTPLVGPMARPIQPEAAGRVLLALSGLAALSLDPPDFTVAPRAMIPLLLGYLAFAAWCLVQDLRGVAPSSRTAWFDLGWGLALTAVSGGTSSVLFFFLLLPIMSRSFRDGFAAGWKMTLVTTGGFFLVGLPTSPGGALFEFNRAMIRPLTLMILGFMLAREGGVQKRAQRRLVLLAQLNTIANPRFGVDRTLVNAAQRIREVYRVRECLILLARDDGPPLTARATAEETRIETLPAAAASPLLALPDDLRVIHSPRRSAPAGAASEGLADQCQGLADMLETPALLTVPLIRSERAVGRIYVLDKALPQFDQEELEFLAEAAGHLLLILDKVDLLDRLASLAAERERRRLANDLHDLAIQPYLGLQIGIEAALRRPACPAAVAEDLRGLLRLARQGTEELRHMLAGQRVALGAGDLLSESLLRLSQQYTSEFGIEVSTECPQDLQLSDRLAAELIGMISEGLSNVRRHTASPWARLRLAGEGDALSLSIANAGEPGSDRRFRPKSIHERALALGGEARVACTDAGETVVSVRIPL